MASTIIVVCKDRKTVMKFMAVYIIENPHDYKKVLKSKRRIELNDGGTIIFLTPRTWNKYMLKYRFEPPGHRDELIMTEMAFSNTFLGGIL